MCREEVNAFSWTKRNVSAPENGSKYLQELNSLEEHILKDITRELERLESFTGGLKKLGFVEHLKLKQLGSVGADLRRLSAVVNAVWSDSKKNSENTDNLQKRICDLERKLKKFESVEQLVKEESAILSNMAAEREWCFSRVLMEHESHKGTQRCWTTDFDGLRNILKRLKYFEGLRESLSCASIKSLGLRCLDVEDLKRDLGNEGLCSENLESQEGIESLRKSLLETIERDEEPVSSRRNTENIESIRRRHAERLSLKGLSLEDVMRLTESIDEKFEKLESLEKLGERITLLAEDLRISAIKILAGLESFDDLDRAAISERDFQAECHWDDRYNCYKLKDEQRKRAKMLISLSREFGERLGKSLTFRKYLGKNLFSLRVWFEYLLKCIGNNSENHAITDASETYKNFPKLEKNAAKDLEMFLERAINGSTLIFDKHHKRYRYTAQRHRENVCQDDMSTIQSIARSKKYKKTSRKSSRTILATIPEERGVHETLELLVRSTCNILDKYIEVESIRHRDLASTSEGAEREIASLREDLQRHSEREVS